MKIIRVILTLAVFFNTVDGFAKPSQPADSQKPLRKKELDFEESILEGLSDRGLESFIQTGTIDSASRDKLYRKRGEFEEESKGLLREMEFLK